MVAVLRAGHSALQDIFPQGDCTIMLLIPCRVDEGDRLIPRHRAQLLQLLILRVQFLSIALLKLVPARNLMPEPLAQLGAWREFLHPVIQAGLFFGHTAWPETLDEDSNPVLIEHRLVNPLELDVIRRNARRSEE